MKKFVSLLLVLAMLFSFGILEAATAEELPTLKFLISSSFFDIEGDVTAEATQRLSGYNIEYELLNGTTQLMLMISSGEPYDYVTLSKTNWDLMMSNGALTDITDLLAEYGPHITEGYTTVWPSVTVDGRIYGIPSVAAQPNSLNRSMIARKDLLDAIGYTEDKLPTTLDAFIKMLEDLKAAYPDMIPLTSEKQYIYTNIASSFNVLGEQSCYQYVDGHVICVLDNPNLEAYITTMRDLYARGLLDVDMPAQDKKASQSKFAAGQAVIEYASWNGCESYIASLGELVPTSEWEVLPLLEDENGKVHSQVKSGVAAYGGFPVTGEHTIDAIKAINNMMEPTNYKEIVLGVEGVHYQMVDGEIVPIQPAFTDEKNNSNSFVGGFYREDVYPTYWEVRLKKSDILVKAFYSMRESLLDGGVASPTALAPTVTVVDNLSTLEGKITDTLVAVIAGTEPMSAIDDCRAYWKNNGGDKVVEFYDAWYNENIVK